MNNKKNLKHEETNRTPIKTKRDFQQNQNKKTSNNEHEKNTSSTEKK